MSTIERHAARATRAAPQLNRAFIAALMFANLGANVALIAPIQNILPRMIESTAGASGKALGLGIVTGIGAFAALVVNPLAGHVSDRWLGADNRVLTLLAGLVLGGAAHVVLGYQHSLVDIAIWWTICQATINIAYAPMSAVVVDHVDRRSWGLVWGLISVAQAVGLIIGLTAVVYVFPSVTAGMTAISVGYVVCLIPLVVVLCRLPRVSYPDDQVAGGAVHGRDGLRALLSTGQGFGLVWAGKFLVILAETIALLYLYYYLQDVVHYRNPGQGQLILVLIATLAVIAATVAVGRVADQSGGYRRYAVLASVVMAATGFVLAGCAVWALVIVCAFALGVGYGAFQSVSQALSMVVLPSRANAGRDLGIINIASAIPQVIGAPIAGLVVAGAGGYRGLFVFAGLLALAAAVVFARVPAGGGSPAARGGRPATG
ncbi:MAG: MFS transporter [Trebonia sp.]